MLKMFNTLLHEKKPEEKEKEYISVKLYCVVEDLSDANDELIKSIRNYSLQKNVLFETRVYNSYKNANDRNFIRTLPAFHIYINNSYNRTFYPNTRPFQHINESIQIYLDKIERKKKKTEAWNNYVDSNRFRLRYICGLTSLMERYRNN